MAGGEAAKNPIPRGRRRGGAKAVVEVVIVNWKRPENVRRIVAAFAQQKRLCSITLIEAANQPQYALPQEVLRKADRHFIFSDNFGSFNRFVPCLGYMAPYTLFHDDDLLPGRHAIEHLLLCAAEHPHFSVMGEFGRHISAEGKELTRDQRRSPPQDVTGRFPGSVVFHPHGESETFLCRRRRSRRGPDRLRR